MAYKQLSELLQEFRKKTLNKEGKPFSLMDLSLEIGWANPSTLSRIENGDVKPARETVIKIAHALRLNQNDLNLLLRTSEYKDYNPELTDAYIQNFVDTVKKGYDELAYPVALLDSSARMVYWNRFMEVFLLGSRMAHEQVVIRFWNITHIDLLFNPEYGIRENIVNWDEFSRILVENSYFHVSQLVGQKIDNSFIERWMHYPGFKDLWDECEQVKSGRYTANGVSFVYRNIELGVVQLTINSSLTYEDNRFFIEQFNPATKEDAKKLRKYWDKVKEME